LGDEREVEMTRGRQEGVSMTGSDVKHSETLDGATGQPDPAPRRIDLSSLRDVRIELAAVYRKMDSGEIASQEGTRRAYVLKTIHDVIVSAELERRQTELEERHVRRTGAGQSMGLN
jgi:hypothetical protein